MTEQETRDQLGKTLQSEPNNYGKILELSNRLSTFDQKGVRFSIDAGVIDRLGNELVARQETAVSELVKNAYDADANLVKLTFKDSDDTGGTLLIEDDGDGMSRDELVNGFMRISSTDKVHNPFSRKYKRRRAGKKGIGRFAVQRLGRELTIITQTKDSESAHKLSINWNLYEQDINLTSVSNSLEIIPKTKDSGTELIISDLRDKWSTASIKRIYRYVSDIIQPYPLSEERTESELNRKLFTEDNEFNSDFYKKNGNNDPELIADNATEIFNHATAIFEGWVDKNGKGIYSVNSEVLGIDEMGEIGKDPEDVDLPFDHLSKIKFRAYYFILDQLPKQHLSHIRKFLGREGSIRLYRNGFRVLPYGEIGDDWLKLDASLRTRSILPPHGNNNFYGLVEMIDNNDAFMETSSREGLADGEALKQLRNFIYRTLMSGVIRIAEARNIKVSTSQDKNNGQWNKMNHVIGNMFKTIEELDQEYDNETSTPEKKKRRKKKVKKILDELKKIEALQKSQQSTYIKEQSMLRVLSSVGLSIAQFIHEIKYYMGNMKTDVNYLVQNLQGNTEALNRSLILQDNFTSFKTYTSYFDDVVSKNVIRELEYLDMEEVVNDFVTSIGKEADRSKISVNLFEPPVYRIFTKKMHPSEWASILFNFYTNSKKAINRSNVDFGHITIEIGMMEKMLFLEFSDNGDGIPNGVEERIFDEFFTTTSSKDFESIDADISGTGLGLKIVKDIIRSYRGNISVVSPKDNYSTTIRIELPAATDKEIEENDL